MSVLLRKEDEENPYNYNAGRILEILLYCQVSMRRRQKVIGKRLKEEHLPGISEERFFGAGKSLLRLFWLRPELAKSDEDADRVARRTGYPDVENPDIYYFLALYYTKREDYGRAYTEMERALTCVDTYREADTIYLRGDLERAYGTMAGICQKLGKKQEIVRYAVLSLRLNRYQEESLWRSFLSCGRNRGKAARRTGPGNSWEDCTI